MDKQGREGTVVRYLINSFGRVTILARGASIEIANLGLIGTAAPPIPAGAALQACHLPMALAQLEERMIRTALAETAGNRAEAARRLGIRRQLLYAKLRHYGIEQ